MKCQGMTIKNMWQM